MKAIFLSLIFVFLITISALLVIVAPYHFYSFSMKNGIENNFLSLKKPNPRLMKSGNLFKNPIQNINENVWEEFPFYNFNFRLPIRDLSFYFVLHPYDTEQGVQFDLDVLNLKNEKLLEIKYEEVSEFQMFPFKDNVFFLPMFEKYIYGKGKENIWNDLYINSILKLEEVNGSSVTKRWAQVWKLSYRNLVYNLYLLKLRDHYLNGHGQFGKNTDLDFYTLSKEDEEYLYDRLLFYKKGKIYTLTLKSAKEHIDAERLRQHILSSARVSLVGESTSIHSYARFKDLPYRDKITQIGFLYLVSAWTHDREKEGFLKEIIFYLEKSEGSIFQLTPLYQFAIKKYGTNFSSNRLEESFKKKMEREAAEKLQRELEDAKNSTIQDGTFSSEEEKIKFNLQKGREDKLDKDMDNGDLLSY